MRRSLKLGIVLALLMVGAFWIPSQRGESQTRLFIGSDDNSLEKLNLVKKVVYLIDEHYVEPQRISPGEMFQAVLKRMQEQIPEVRLMQPTSASLELVVNRERLSFSKEMVNIHSLPPAIVRALLFTKKNLVSKTITDENLETLAIQGILSTLDPHSIFLPKELWEQTKLETLQGSFGGVGIVIAVRNGKLTIIAPIDDTPAARAGLKSGDHIIRINDESTVNMDTSEAANLMRGPRDTNVRVTVSREGWPSPKEFPLTRATIRTQSVESKELTNGILFLRVKNFQANTTEDVRRHMKTALDRLGKLRGVILDLRNDPGGLLTQAIDLTDLFVADGTIVSTVNRSNKEQRREVASSLGTFADFPMVVLVNEGSASASEIVAGAIKYLDRGLVVGRRTFGKSSVQMLFDLPNQAAFKLTVEKYLTSNGQSLQNVGIIPDIQIDPARVDDELVSLFGSSFHLGEEGLEGHFNPTVNSSDTARSNHPKDHPTYSLRYFANKADEENEFQPIKEPMQDFEIAFAWKLLDRSRFLNRKQLVKDLRPVIEEEQMAQRQQIANALVKRGIVWDVARKNAKIKGCQPPTVSSEIVGTPPGVRAGADVELQIKVVNSGACELYNFWAVTQSEDYFIKQREVLFGTMAPGQSKTASIKIKLPEFLPDRLVSYTLQFFEDEEEYLLDSRKIFAVKGMKEPRFSYSYRFEDYDPNNATAVADGLLKKGESARFYLLVKNIGDGTSKENIAILKNMSGVGIFLKKGRAELGVLKPGETKELVFEFDIRANFEKPELSFDLQVYDSQFGEFLSNKIKFDLTRASTSKFVATTGWYQVPQNVKSVRVWNGAAEENWPIAEIPKGTLVKSLGKMGNQLLVSLQEENNVCKQGWINFKEVQSAPAGMVGRGNSISCRMHAPPRIEIAAGLAIDKVADAKFVTIRGKLLDESELKDIYIVVNKDKVFYQAFQPAQSEAEFEAIVPLQKGVNNIGITARDQLDFFEQKRAVILYKPEEAKNERLSFREKPN